MTLTQCSQEPDIEFEMLFEKVFSCFADKNLSLDIDSAKEFQATTAKNNQREVS